MLYQLKPIQPIPDDSKRMPPHKAGGRSFLIGFVCLAFLSISVSAQQSAPAVVQPGAPGQPSKSLPASTRAVLPEQSKKDVEFMQGMIMHHVQAVEMTALIEARTETKDLRLLGR